MPAVMPAELQTAPSRMKMRSGSSLIWGYRAANSPVRLPMRGRALAVEQAGRGEQEGSRADARDPTRASRRFADEADQIGIAKCRAHALAAGDDQRVERRRVGERPWRPWSRRKNSRPSLPFWRERSARRRPPIARRDAEGGDRTGGVEQLEIRKIRKPTRMDSLWLVSREPCHLRQER